MTDKTIYWKTGGREKRKKKHNSADCYIQIRLADIVSLKRFRVRAVARMFFFFVMITTACPALICSLRRVVKSNRYIFWLTKKRKMNSILSMKAKASCVQESHFILFWPRDTWYKILFLFSLYCCGKWSGVYADQHIVLSLMPFWFYYFLYKKKSVWSSVGLFVCVILFGGNACYSIVSDQQKYLKCMLCLICIEMWFKVCLKNKIHCKN